MKAAITLESSSLLALDKAFEEIEEYRHLQEEEKEKYSKEFEKVIKELLDTTRELIEVSKSNKEYEFRRFWNRGRRELLLAEIERIHTECMVNSINHFIPDIKLPLTPVEELKYLVQSSTVFSAGVTLVLDKEETELLSQLLAGDGIPEVQTISTPEIASKSATLAYSEAALTVGKYSLKNNLASEEALGVVVGVYREVVEKAYEEYKNESTQA